MEYCNYNSFDNTKSICAVNIFKTHYSCKFHWELVVLIVNVTADTFIGIHSLSYYCLPDNQHDKCLFSLSFTLITHASKRLQFLFSAIIINNYSYFYLTTVLSIPIDELVHRVNKLKSSKMSNREKGKERHIPTIDGTM